MPGEDYQSVPEVLVFTTNRESARLNIQFDVLFVVCLLKSDMTELSDLAIRETVMPIHIIITIIASNNIIVIILVRRGLVCEI